MFKHLSHYNYGNIFKRDILLQKIRLYQPQPIAVSFLDTKMLKYLASHADTFRADVNTHQAVELSGRCGLHEVITMPGANFKIGSTDVTWKRTKKELVDRIVIGP